MSEPVWNRRFVCPDKNGDKVYAGDEVWLEFSPDKLRAIRAIVSADMVHGVLFTADEFTTDEDSWDWDQVGKIELVKEDK